MAWGLLRRLSPLKRLRDFVRGVDARDLQRRADTHRLYLYTQLREQLQAGGQGGGGGHLPAAAEAIVARVSCSRGEQRLSVLALPRPPPFGPYLRVPPRTPAHYSS
jgi:hypothetical protein